VNQPYTDERLERALLSTVFLDNSTLKDVADLFRPDLFASEDHRLIATAMLGLSQAGKPIDRHMVVTKTIGHGRERPGVRRDPGGAMAGQGG
jgi:replicative DNA helicase